MNRRRAVAAAVAALVVHVGRAAAGPPPAPDGPVHVQSSSHLITEGGSELDLPPGYFVTDDQWDALDFEVRRLQDEGTRLRAENESLRASAGGGAPWWAIAAAVVVGAAGGAYAYERWVD